MVERTILFQEDHWNATLDAMLRTYLSELRREHPAMPLAIALDVDGTLLLQQTCLLPVVRIAQFAHQLGISIFIITARPYSAGNHAATLQSLAECGCPRVEDLFMWDVATHGMGFAAYKHDARNDIVQRGYMLALNVGDQWSDLSLFPPELPESHYRELPLYDLSLDRFLVVDLPDDHAWISVKLPGQETRRAREYWLREHPILT